MSAEAGIIKEIRELREAYALFSPLTKRPLVECEPVEYNDQSLLYASKKDAEKAAERYQAAGISADVKSFKIREVMVPVDGKKPDGEKKKMYLNEVRQYLGILPILGVNAIGYTPAGGEQVMVELREVLPEGFEEKIQKSVFYQPNLQLTGLYLMQEARKAKEFKDRNQLQELDEEFSSNLVKSRLFLAVFPPEGHETDPNLNLKECRSLYLKNQDGDFFFPVFTDMWELQEYAKNNQKLRPVPVPFQDLEKFWVQGFKAYVLNPSGFSIFLERGGIPELLKRFGRGV